MSGSHSTRVGIGGVMFPRHNHGLNPSEVTLPELLKDQGYATAIIGKWHSRKNLRPAGVASN